ncbi:hypothetical protein X777_03702 [Ooceraea biroi]|uniref:Uncharacterized protein n=1 Tax=Ooceraea biroi TaxID=2015173 RepID=A0A026WIZ5_OOCBI|nr:hypothetical protein X777_03702 [Ooceraea biroi]
MTGFARGPALIAFYLFLISRTPHRDAYGNGWTDRRTDVSQEGTSGPKGPPPRRGVTPDRVMHRGTCLISHGSLAWDDGRWEGQGVWIREYSSYELADLQLEQTHYGRAEKPSNTAFFFPSAEESDQSTSWKIVWARKERKYREGKGRGNDSLAFFVKQVEIGVMLMEFREIPANHMLSRAVAAKVGGKAGPSQKY